MIDCCGTELRQKFQLAGLALGNLFGIRVAGIQVLSCFLLYFAESSFTKSIFSKSPRMIAMRICCGVLPSLVCCSANKASFMQVEQFAPRSDSKQVRRL